MSWMHTVGDAFGRAGIRARREAGPMGRKHVAFVVASCAALVAAAATSMLAQDDVPPDAIAGYQSERLAPGVWWVIEDSAGNVLDQALWDVRVGPDGSAWVLSNDGALKLGVAGSGPRDPRVDRLFDVDAEGNAWLRYQGFDRQGFGTWDGSTWTDVSRERRPSALEADATRAPGVIRDLAIGTEGSIWVVAGEQDSPRWQRFTIERLDEDGWTTWAIGDGLPELACGKNCGDGSRVVALDDGTVWVSVDQGGLLRYDGDDWQAVRPLADDTDHPISTLLGNPAGFLWADLDAGPEVADEPVRAAFDGADWVAPAHAQVHIKTVIEGPAARAVGAEGTLWVAGQSDDGRPILWAIDEGRRRVVPDLGLCPEPNDARGCWDVTSIAVGPDGLVWVGTSSLEGDGALLVIDPAVAFDA
jgi:hypothetical protein